MFSRQSARRVRQGALGFVGAAALVVSMAATAAPASADPPGANGTVKIDGVPFDTAPDNEPHVGCRFQVDFYGFDAGDFHADVTFAVQPPTGQFVDIRSDTVFIGEDAAGGGTDLDAQRTYDLTSALASYSPHPQQGYHVKLSVAAPGVGGKVATKSKVFWVGPCESYPPPYPS